MWSTCPRLASYKGFCQIYCYFRRAVFLSDNIRSATALFVTKRHVYDGISTKSGVGGGGGGGMCSGFLESLLCALLDILTLSDSFIGVVLATSM